MSALIAVLCLPAAYLQGLAGAYGALFLAFLCASIVGAGAELAMRSRRRQLTIEEENRSLRIVAERSMDMLMRVGSDGRILYVSPSCSKVIGWSPEQLFGTHSTAGVNPEDLPRFLACMDDIRSGVTGETKLIYRQRRKNRPEIWLWASVSATFSPKDGTVDGAVVVFRDVTEQQEARQSLLAQASTDGLTGLDNRRSFDQHLEQHWRGALRDHRPLSLLLVDVDHFKRFNDLYGHPAGDGCLKEIGRILQTLAARLGGVAGRYGGEEFTLLLPNTDSRFCHDAGDALRQLVESARIRHDGNLPRKLVTISAGGASMIPEPGMDCSHLVKMADQALYLAKEIGRNKVVMSGRVIPFPESVTA